MDSSDLKLLVIDDNPDITNLVRYYCESKKIDCQVTHGGVEGLAAIDNNKFDLILLDLVMPEFTGLDVINSLKSKGLIYGMNIVAITKCLKK